MHAGKKNRKENSKWLGGNDVLEVAFAQNVPDGGIVIGDTVTFKFLYKGQPLKNTEVNAAYVGAPVYFDEDEKVDANEAYMTTITDEKGEASFTFDHQAGWFVGKTIINEDDEEYGGGVMFEVSKTRNVGSGGGGCDTGTLALFVSAGLAIGMIAARRKSR
jgi:hypothetical protein